MCRWLAYSGDPLLIEDLIYRPAHSLVDQSLRARLGVETTNGDGFGIGWYADTPTHEPAIFRSIGPAWSDRNLRELAGSVRTRLCFAHIRASTGTAVQQTNCHPFRHGQWLWMHNGAVVGWSKVKRDLMFAVDPSLFPFIEGSTDSEVMFYLALTFGLREDPPGAVARMAHLVEQVGFSHDIPNPMQMTVATSDGERIWAFRYSTQRASRTLFVSADARTLWNLYPDHDIVRKFSADARLIVSEPVLDLEGAWQELPESSYLCVQPGDDDIAPFEPKG